MTATDTSPTLAGATSPGGEATVLPATPTTPGRNALERAVLALVRRLPHDAIVVDDGRVYMERYFIARWRGRSARLHRILLSDELRDLHDHPWGRWITIGLHGSYREHLPDGITTLRAPWCRRKRGTDLHALEVDAPVWTLVLLGRKTREWGFETDRGWVPWSAYESKMAETGKPAGWP